MQSKSDFTASFQAETYLILRSPDSSFTRGFTPEKDHLYVHMKDVRRALVRKETSKLISEPTQEKNLISARSKAELKDLRLKGTLLITKEDTKMKNPINEKYVEELL
jgi:hypothetical protein